MTTTAYLFLGEGMDELLAIGPPDFPLLGASAPVSAGEVVEHGGRVARSVTVERWFPLLYPATA